MTEIDLCESIKKANLFPEYKLHEEVGISGVSCDLVYENGDKVFCIEAKMHLNAKVIEQACRWRNVATASFVAVPFGSVHDWFHNPKRTIIEELGLGLILAADGVARFVLDYYNPLVESPYRSNNGIYQYPADWEYWRPCFDRIGENECPAGSKIGKRSTTFTRTIDALKIEAKKHPDYNLKQLLAIVPTHYSSIKSAEGAIRRYAKYGVVEKFWNTNEII